MLYKNLIKPVIDFVISLLAITILLPFLAVICVILYFSNNGKVFFFQERPGKNEKRIKIIKFKSMTDKRDANNNLLPDVERITKFGHFIRKYSLDELPQLFNVLKGDMSLVGPRPLLFKYIPLFSPEQKKRHDLKPGITGWAQINGRNSISWTEKFKYDVYYTRNISFMLDVKILWLTVLKVIKKEGINQSQEAPMEPFNGNN